jgi:hypothetical protein
MLFLIGAVIVAPTVVKLTNRVLEEYIIPRQVMKKAAEGKVQLFPVGFDVAVTPEEMKKLKEAGALDILQQGAHRHQHLANAGVAPVCELCRRLKD